MEELVRKRIRLAEVILLRPEKAIDEPGNSVQWVIWPAPGRIDQVLQQ